jgi:hypothetical protein
LTAGQLSQQLFAWLKALANTQEHVWFQFEFLVSSNSLWMCHRHIKVVLSLYFTMPIGQASEYVKHSLVMGDMTDCLRAMWLATSHLHSKVLEQNKGALQRLGIQKISLAKISDQRYSHRTSIQSLLLQHLARQ